ncbi:hypothetical protein GTW69_27110, partial [Streptomyces sp. SID7760]|nr:hypothetical protein [Streptomyces sp. SID7760]
AGERLRDAEVVRALHSALACGGLALRNVACRVEPAAAAAEPGPAHYVFAIAPRTPWHQAETVRFAAALDRGLAEQSAGYAGARAAGRLAAPSVRLLDAEAFDRDWHEAVGAGVRPTQVKDRLFRQDDALWERLTRVPLA